MSEIGDLDEQEDDDVENGETCGLGAEVVLRLNLELD